MSDDAFLSRWSRRKQAARDGIEEPRPPEAGPPAAPVPVSPVAASPTPEPPAPLPPLASLTPESDFAPFMRPEVDGDMRRQALKTLFSDPRCNVMDGLDVYIDDYTKTTPMPEGWLEKMVGAARLGDWKPPVVAEGEGPPPIEAPAGGEIALAQNPTPEPSQVLPDAKAPGADAAAEPDFIPRPE